MHTWTDVSTAVVRVRTEYSKSPYSSHGTRTYDYSAISIGNGEGRVLFYNHHPLAQRVYSSHAHLDVAAAAHGYHEVPGTLCGMCSSTRCLLFTRMHVQVLGVLLVYQV